MLDWLAAPPTESFAPDETVLLRLSRLQGLPVHQVPAAPAYRATGAMTQPAFQKGLLLAMVAKDFHLDAWLLSYAG